LKIVANDLLINLVCLNYIAQAPINKADSDTHVTKPILLSVLQQFFHS